MAIPDSETRWEKPMNEVPPGAGDARTMLVQMLEQASERADRALDALKQAKERYARAEMEHNAAMEILNALRSADKGIANRDSSPKRDVGGAMLAEDGTLRRY